MRHRSETVVEAKAAFAPAELADEAFEHDEDEENGNDLSDNVRHVLKSSRARFTEKVVIELYVTAF